MIAVHITCNTGKTWPSSFNGTFYEAGNYLLGKTFTDETEEGVETHHKCTHVELISPAPLEAFSSDWFNDAFNSATGLTSQLRYLSENITRHFKIRGICDPLYIANVIAHELGTGDGCSNFNGTSVTADESIIDKLTKRLSSSYSCNIPANSALLRSLLTLTLGLAAQTKRPHQHEIDAEVQKALETKMRHGYTTTAVVGMSTTQNGGTSLGFHFDNIRSIGEVFSFEDGTMFEVLALV